METALIQNLIINPDISKSNAEITGKIDSWISSPFRQVFHNKEVPL